MVKIPSSIRALPEMAFANLHYLFKYCGNLFNILSLKVVFVVEQRSGFFSYILISLCYVDWKKIQLV
jgi:hypothetical protein